MSQFQPPMPRRTNGYAIAGLVTALVCCSPLAIIFSSIAIKQIERDPNQDGKGLAMAGMFIGFIGVLLGFISILLWLYTPFWDDFWTAFMEGYNGY